MGGFCCILLQGLYLTCSILITRLLSRSLGGRSRLDVQTRSLRRRFRIFKVFSFVIAEYGDNTYPLVNRSISEMFITPLRCVLLVTVLCLCACNRSKETGNELMDICFKAAPQLRTTLNNLEAEISKWQETEDEFTRMRDAAQTGGGRATAEAKLSKIKSVLADLNRKHHTVLEQIEMIAMESEGMETKLDKIALEDLARRAGDSVQDAEELREEHVDASGSVPGTKEVADFGEVYRKAGEQGHADAQKNLDALLKKDKRMVALEASRGLFELGKPFPRDFFDQVDKDDLRSLAEAGNAEAQFLWGRVHTLSSGLLQDNREAVKWYRKAANQGHSNSQTNLGVMYAQGLGVARNDREAVYWYRRAAAQGNAMGTNNLGWMYEHGLGVFKDEPEAVKWYRLAAARGNARAQKNLDIIIQRGR